MTILTFPLGFSPWSVPMMVPLLLIVLVSRHLCSLEPENQYSGHDEILSLLDQVQGLTQLRWCWETSPPLRRGILFLPSEKVSYEELSLALLLSAPISEVVMLGGVLLNASAGSD